MPSPLPAESSPGQSPEPAALDELITQARRLRGGVDAVRRGAEAGEAGEAGEAQKDAATPRGRWERALCDLAVAQLDELGGRLSELRAGAAGPGPRPRLTGSAEWNLLTDEVTWSQDLFDIFARSAEDGPLSLDELPSWVVETDQPSLTAAVTDTLVDGRPLDVEFRIVRPDGAVRALHMAGEAELDAEGDTASLWAVLRDVSALRRDEQAVRDSRESSCPSADRRQEGTGTVTEAHEAVLPRWRGPGHGRTGSGPGRLDVASRYLPCENSPLIGGAWFDALPLSGGDTVVTVGELTGRGVASASGMAMLLGAVRGMALAGVEPGILMRHLDELLEAAAQPPLGSAVCGRYTPQTGLLTWSQAGSCAPMLIRRGAGRRLQAPSGALPDTSAWPDTSACTPRPQHSVRLEPGDVLVLHTAGLTEPGSGAGADRLLGLGPQLGAFGTARECLQAVVEECTGAERHEDAGVLIARLPG